MRPLVATLALALSALAAPTHRQEEEEGTVRYVPFYGTSANGHTSAARGWNSFGLQANPAAAPDFAFDDAHFAQQCGFIRVPDLPNVAGAQSTVDVGAQSTVAGAQSAIADGLHGAQSTVDVSAQSTIADGLHDAQSAIGGVDAGADYYCSLDSGWSGNGGDAFGRIVPEPGVFTAFPPVLRGLADHLHARGVKLGVYLLPGAFESDRDVIIEGTDIRLGDVLDFEEVGYNLRRAFRWGAPGVQEWHDSVVKHLAALGVDMIKLDFLTPGSPDAGEALPADTSPSAAHYHAALARLAPHMRLDLSWKLVRTEPAWSRWRMSADALRLDQDINNAQSRTLVSFATVQRAIEQYRLFILEQVQDPTRRGTPIRIRPDMDNTYVGNDAGLSDVQRYTVAIHWLGAGANLITGSDMTRLDALGAELLFDAEALRVARFTAQWPMQPLRAQASQLHAWVAGPSPSEEGAAAVVVLANYGPDLGQGGFGTALEGVRWVNASLAELGLGGSESEKGWRVRRVWGGGGSGGGDHEDAGVVGGREGDSEDRLAALLGPGESVLLRLTRV